MIGGMLMNPFFATPLVISLDEFENAIKKKWFVVSDNVIIRPILQFWGHLVDGRFRATGYLMVSGIIDNGIIVAAYNADSIEKINAHCEMEKFKELIQLTFEEFLDSFTIIEIRVDEL
jgi:hypothetical protein